MFLHYLPAICKEEKRITTGQTGEPITDISQQFAGVL
jgi:hypothetical protein